MPNGQLAVGDTDGVIKVWELIGKNPSLIWQKPASVNSDDGSVISSLSVSPQDNSTLAAAYLEEVPVIRFWNSRTGDPLGRDVELRWSGSLESIKYSPDGQHLVFFQLDSQTTYTVSVVDVETRKLVTTKPAGHSETVSEVAFSHDGKLMATASRDHTIRIWNTTTWEPISILKGHYGEVSSVVFSHNDHWLYSGGKDGRIRAWRTSRNSPPFDVIPYDDDEVSDENEGRRDIAMSWDGSAFCTARENDLVTVLDVASGKNKSTPMPPLQEKADIPVKGHLPLAVSRNGRMLATALWDESIQLWNVEKDEQITVKTSVRTRVVDVEFSPAGDALIILRADGQLEKVPMATAQASEVLPPQADTRPHSISFSNDGSRVAIGQLDGRVSAWKFADDRLVSGMARAATFRKR